jgi:phosphate starvation-inducible protein PhoH
VQFDGHDVVRHKLVQRIVNAYKAHDDEIGAARAQRKQPPGSRREVPGA